MASLPTGSKSKRANSGNSTESPRSQDTAVDMRESTDFVTQTSTTSASNDDQLVNAAIAYATFAEGVESAESDATAPGTPEGSDDLDHVLNSSGKCLSIVLNNQTTPPPVDHPIANFDGTSQGIATQLVDVRPRGTVPPPLQPIVTTAAASGPTSSKKPHIMISYQRSSQDVCERMRNRLTDLKYVVWMDRHDMPNNFIDGMARAVSNSYIVLMCLSQQYNDSFWCRKEAESTVINRINFIPCILEDPYTPADWLALILGASIRVDFSNAGTFEDAFHELLTRISYIEFELAINPRLSPTTPIPPNVTVESVDDILRDFKTWVQRNRDSLRQSSRQESAQLIRELIRGLQDDPSTLDDDGKRELLQQLLSTTSQGRTDLVPGLLNSLGLSDALMVKGLLLIMALWAMRVVFKRD